MTAAPKAKGEPPPSDVLPKYALSLTAYHRAFAAELAECVAGLGVSGRVLDVPCGDGFFAACFAGRGARVVAADLSPAFLKLASRACRTAGAVEFVQADAYRLPFPDRSFDLVWCAQSLISLSAPVKVLAEMRRVVRPGGAVAVLETDELHHLMLNWPSDLEQAVQKATLAEATGRFGGAGRLSPSRWVGRAMLDAGLWGVRKRTVTADRQMPFDERTADYLRLYLGELRERVWRSLAEAQLTAFDLYPHSEASLTCLNTLFVGRR